MCASSFCGHHQIMTRLAQHYMHNWDCMSKLISTPLTCMQTLTNCCRSNQGDPLLDSILLVTKTIYSGHLGLERLLYVKDFCSPFLKTVKPPAYTALPNPFVVHAHLPSSHLFALLYCELQLKSKCHTSLLQWVCHLSHLTIRSHNESFFSRPGEPVRQFRPGLFSKPILYC